MTGWARRFVVAAGVLALVGTTGCPGFFVYPGSTSSSSSSNNYVYVANATSSTVAGFSVGTATLTAVTNSPYTLPFVPTALAVNPANTLLIVAGYTAVNGGSIYVYSIGSGGALTLLKSNAVGLVNVVAMDISPDGQWLVGVDGSATQTGIATVDEYGINATTGQLTQQTGANYAMPTGTGTILPRSVRFAPNGQLVFLGLGTAGDLVYSFNTASTSGALSLVQTLTLSASSGTSDNALTVSGNSSYLFIARSGVNSGLAVYTVGSNGSLSLVSSMAAGTQPYAVTIDTTGSYVYVANRADSTISGYSVGSNASLTALTGSPYTSGSGPTALFAERSGKYLLAAANGGSPDLTMYSFDGTTAGKLDISTTTASGTDPAGAVGVAGVH